MSENQTAHLDKDVQDNKVYAILAYFGLLFLVPLLAAKESPFARFHTNQGILVFVGYVAAWIVTTVLTLISYKLAIIGTVLYIALFVLQIIGIVNAAQGKKKELPLIGGLFQFVK